MTVLCNSRLRGRTATGLPAGCPHSVADKKKKVPLFLRAGGSGYKSLVYNEHL